MFNRQSIFRALVPLSRYRHEALLAGRKLVLTLIAAIIPFAWFRRKGWL
jgi:hypothetical protein